ncbi:MAG: alpha-mannosidase [Planctomycetota bacterium]
MMIASLILSSILSLASAHDDDTCLLLVAKNLSDPGGNFYLYQQIHDREIKIQAGDMLKYELFLLPSNPSAKGGMDILFSGGKSLRDSGATDEKGLRAHGDSILTNASGKWLARTIDLTTLADLTTQHFIVHFEGDEKGEFVQFIDNISIERADGTAIILYDNGQPKVNRVDWKNGYSESCLCVSVPREKVKIGPELDALIKDKKAKQVLYDARESLKTEIDLAERFAMAENRGDIVKQLKTALDSVPSPDEFKGTEAEYHDILHKQRKHLDHAHPLMKKYSGQLVGHAHIDLQWLWEWPEGLDCSRSTFEQVCKFMDEYPEFTFSQSSAGLYQKIEEQYSGLFETIKKRVAEGRFEIVGGRWCEGDTNLISGESHARHLLYGQRYFKKAFGKIATVGWEPDTFGHTIQMPQIMKLGGIDSYYFCRGGKNVPLFWWESPDGTRMLTFDEPASGSWYNSDIVNSNVSELLSFYEKTGLKDLIWVYGVGNHGGGPTREMIEKAISWKDKEGRPTVQFSTARKFFDLCKEKNLDKLPVIKDELNPVFRGCYTTHGDIKSLNHYAETELIKAESFATMASRSNYPYPSADLARAWETVCWNHHHDTLPGSGIHDSYELSHVQLNDVIERAKWIQRSAIRHLAYRVEDKGEGDGIIVMNPLGWERDAHVRVEIPKQQKGTPRVVDSNGNRLTFDWHPEELSPGSAFAGQYSYRPNIGYISFIAKGIPAFGYESYRVVWPDSTESVSSNLNVVENDTTVILENEFLKAAVDRATAHVTSLIDKSNGNREVLTSARRGNRIEAHMEAPHGMSAWETGKISEVRICEPATTKGKVRRSNAIIQFETELQFENSKIKTIVSLQEGKRSLDFETTLDWNEIGTSEKPAPMIRVAFPVAAPVAKNSDGTQQKPNFTFNCGVPFASVARPADGEDVAGLNWAWALGPEGGAAFINDTKRGYSCTNDGELRLTLVRSSYEPDPRPDQYIQTIRYSILPLTPGAKTSAVTRAAMEFNIPAAAHRVLHNHHNSFVGDRTGGALPARDSLITFDGLADAIPTALKRAENGNDMIVRLYQESADLAEGNVLIYSPAHSSVREIQTVNFLEEPCSEPLQIITPRPGPAPAHAQGRVKLRGYEIKTLRIAR